MTRFIAIQAGPDLVIFPEDAADHRGLAIVLTGRWLADIDFTLARDTMADALGADWRRP